MSDQAADLDHTSFAVHDGLAHARRLRRLLGATPIFGEELPEFRYLLLHVGDADKGARIELLEPTGPGFLRRFLDKHGEGPHHLTFQVPDLRATVAALRELGVEVVGENHDHPPWREAFVMPDATHGVVIQVAQTDRRYPPTAELLAAEERDVADYPTSAGATDPLWWTPLWSTARGPAARLGTTHLVSGNMTQSRRLFAGVLCAEVTSVGDRVQFSWPSGTITVEPGDCPGVTGLALYDGPAEGVPLGSARLEAPANNGRNPG